MSDVEPSTDAPPPIDPLKHQGLVRSIARRYTGRGLDLDDLISAGQIGLLRACSDFDPARGWRFSTYATGWIKAAIQTELISGGGLIRPAARAAKARFGSLSPAEQDRLARARSVTREADFEAGRSLSSLILDHRGGVVGGKDEPSLAAALSQLDQAEAAVIRLHFGLDSKRLPMPKVAVALGITGQHAWYLRAKALKALRAILGREAPGRDVGVSAMGRRRSA